MRYKALGGAKELWTCREPEVCICGPAGTGKSRAAIEKCYAYAIRFPGARVLLTRSTRTSMSETVLQCFEDHVCPKDMFHGVKRNFRTQYELPNGSQIIVIGCDDPDRLMSSEFNLIFVEEATELTEDQFDKLCTRKRAPGTEFNQMILSCNPGAPNHWIKRFIDSGRVKLITSTHNDNPTITTDYIESLKRLTGHRYARLYLGQWAAAEGLIWDLAECVVPHQDPPKGEHYGGLDFGFRDPFAAVLGVVYADEGGLQVLYIHDERKEAELPIAVHAEWLKSHSNADTVFYCDHENPEAISELRKHDIAAISANKNILFGLESVQGLIAGKRLFISDRCKKLLDSCASFAYSQDSEKPAKGLDDHLPDALRYLVATLRSHSMMEIECPKSA